VLGSQRNGIRRDPLWLAAKRKLPFGRIFYPGVRMDKPLLDASTLDAINVRFDRTRGAADGRHCRRLMRGGELHQEQGASS
jgi:hypothetical protein